MTRAAAALGAAIVLALATSSALAAPAASAAADPAAPAASAGPPHFHDADGLRVLSVHRVDARLLALTVATDALPGPANVRILLPAGYSSHRHRRFPVLYLLHGTSGGAADWTTMGGAEQTTAGLGLIVVMPDIALGDDGGGWCTNWYNGGAYGRPEWETFHIDQLIPWVDANLRTIADRDGRAIAGLSQGGFCSMSYAARHPDLFETALSFSGAPDTAYDTQAQLLVTPIINATEVFLDGVPADSMFGPRMSEEINWAAHDPTTLANNLRDMNLLMYTGNGSPGPLDPSAPNPGAEAIEAGVQQLTILFHDRLAGTRHPELVRRLRPRHAQLAVLGARPTLVDRSDHGRLRAPPAPACARSPTRRPSRATRSTAGRWRCTVRWRSSRRSRTRVRPGSRSRARAARRSSRRRGTDATAATQSSSDRPRPASVPTIW